MPARLGILPAALWRELVAELWWSLAATSYLLLAHQHTELFNKLVK